MRQKGNLARRLFACLALTMLTAFLCGMSAAASTQIVNMDLHPLSNGTSLFMYSGQWGSSDVTAYHYFEMKKPGQIMLMGWSGPQEQKSAVGVTLCDNKKKALGKEQVIQTELESVANAGYVTYALAAGSYCVKTSGVSDYVVGVGVLKKVTQKAGDTQMQAKTIKKGKEIPGVIGAGEKLGTANWFKFKVPKSKALSFDLDVHGDCKACFTLYGPSFKKGVTLYELKNGTRSVHTAQQGGKDFKVQPGTYYIKVSRSKKSKNKNLSAYYTITWS